MKKNGQCSSKRLMLLPVLLLLIFTSTGLNSYGQEKEEEVYKEVAVMPKFQDGDLDTFRKWVMENIKYPDEAKKEKITGKVFAGFIVEKDGSVKEIIIARGVSSSLDNEVIRVIKKSPKWTPGKDQDGKVVRVKYTIPVNFALN